MLLTFLCFWQKKYTPTNEMRVQTDQIVPTGSVAGALDPDLGPRTLVYGAPWAT